MTALGGDQRREDSATAPAERSSEGVSRRARAGAVVRSGRRHVRAGLWAAVALGVVASLASALILHPGGAFSPGAAASH
ncbi:MAG TPA: hypothetical protein VGI58_01645, partial [Streptosporangiaceae bacterium]